MCDPAKGPVVAWKLKRLKRGSYVKLRIGGENWLCHFRGLEMLQIMSEVAFLPAYIFDTLDKIIYPRG